MTQTKIMQNHDETKKTPTSAADITNKSESKVWGRRMAKVAIVMASVGLLICIGLLIQAYITHEPVFELVSYNSFKPGFELLGYNALLFYLSGFLTLIIALNIPRFIDTQQKKLGYVSALIGTVLLFFSFGLLFISYKSSLEWWGYLSKVTSGIGYITLTFSTLVSTERKRLRGRLTFISLVLILAGAILIFFRNS